jgi:predicted enzyme related to lactoylglutathione lyase
MANSFIWFDVAAAEEDVAAVTDFYASIFDGPFGPDTSDGPYEAWMMNGEQPWAAVVRATDATAGRWVPYVQVDDLGSAVEKAISNGGTVVHPESKGPAGTSVTIADPGGALLALFKPFN